MKILLLIIVLVGAFWLAYAWPAATREGLKIKKPKPVKGVTKKQWKAFGKKVGGVAKTVGLGAYSVIAGKKNAEKLAGKKKSGGCRGPNCDAPQMTPQQLAALAALGSLTTPPQPNQIGTSMDPALIKDLAQTAMVLGDKARQYIDQLVELRILKMTPEERSRITSTY